MNKRSIVHIEIPAADRQAGAEFYAKDFGWEYEHMTEPSPYTMLTMGNIGGGMPDVGEMYKAGDVIIYLHSQDVAADLQQIEAHGGKRLSEPFMVGEFGEMAFFADPTGNRLALWKEIQPGSGQ
jgi:predicted enzyme related to lactoylglutathione lyase